MCIYYKYVPHQSQDTVLVSLRVLGRPGHVEEDQPGIMGFIDDHLVEFDGGVHPPHVGMISVTETRQT